jgi:uncharacterized protein (TIGR02300 family)
VANPELGAKQVCPNCQAKFYDLNRRPAHCPKCATDFDPEEAMKLRSRRARPGYPSDDEDTEDQVKDKKVEGDEDEEEDIATPEIDQEGHEPILTPDDEDEDAPADASEEAGMGSTDGDDDLLAEDDDDDSVPFIEDEDDDSIDDEITKPSRDDD